MKKAKNSQKINKKIKKENKKKSKQQKASQPQMNEKINNKEEEDQSAIENYQISFRDLDEGDYSEICDQGVEVISFDSQLTIQEYDDYASAIGYFNAAIGLHPEKDYAYYLKSLSLLVLNSIMELEKLNILDKALIYIKKALSIDPTNEESIQLQSEILFSIRLKLIDRETQSIRKECKRKRKTISFITQEGSCIYVFKYKKLFRDKDQFQDAIIQFEQVIKINPNNYQAYIEKGNSLYQKELYFGNISVIGI